MALAVAAGGTLSLSLLLTSGPAGAVAVPGGGPLAYALNIPSSLIAAAAKLAPGLSSTMSSGVRGALIANNYKADATWQTSPSLSGVSGQNVSTPPDISDLSPGELAKFDQLTAQFTAPATELGTFTKVATVGGDIIPVVGAVLTGAQLGGAVDRMMGLTGNAGLCPEATDASGDLASGIAGILAGITGEDCSSWQMGIEMRSKLNEDVSSGLEGTKSCDDRGCVVLKAIADLPDLDGPGVAGYIRFCFDYSAFDDPHFSSGAPHGSPAGVQMQNPLDDINGPGRINLISPSVSYEGAEWLDCGTDGYPFAATAHYSQDGTGIDSAEQPIGWQLLPAAGEGTPTVAVPTDGDPERTLRCDVTLSTGAVVSASTAEFKESAAEFPTPVCPHLADTQIPDSIKVWETGTTPEKLWATLPIDEEYKNFKTTYPECLNGSCIDVLKYKGKSCFDDPTPCLDWMTNPDRDELFTCTYGTHDVALKECYAYGNLFDPQKVNNGDIYADPETGKDTRTQTSPPGDAGAMSLTPQDGSGPRECFPTGWGAVNPLNWVLEPVQCALEWAFVPRASVITQELAEMQEPWDTKPPGEMTAIVTAWSFNVLPSGCGGIALPVGWLTHHDGQTIQIMAACPGDPLAAMAGWSRFFGDVVFSVYGVVAITRHVSRIFGFGGLGTAGDES